MSDGSITFTTALDNKTLEKQLKNLARKIETIEDKIKQKQAERAPLAQESAMLAARLDAEKARLAYMESGKEFFFKSAIEEQRSKVKELQKEWDAVQTRVERYDAQIKNATIELDRNKEKAGMVEQQLAKAQGFAGAMGTALDKAQVYMDRFSNRVKQLAQRALVFYVITQALRRLREWIGKVIKSNDEARKNIAQLKAALLTLAQPFINVIIPAFIKFVNILSVVMTQLARVVSFLFGKTLAQSREAAKALNEQTKALEDTGKAAEKASKQLAAFDELNVLSDDDKSAGTDMATIEPDFSALEKFDAEIYKKKLDEITLYASGALLALGVILTFSGANIPLGLGLIAVGAAGLAYSVQENWGLIVSLMQGQFGEIFALASGALLVLGLILVCSGVALGLGIGLIVLGAAGLASYAALNWSMIVESIQGTLGEIIAITSAFLLAIGLILVCSGVALPLGISLIAAGAAGLAAVAALNWNKIIEALRGPIGGIVAIASAALLALGIILVCSGVALPLGISLIAAGAAGLVAVTALNWNKIVEEIKGPVSKVITIASAALLMLGLILVCSGVALPLGIALIAAGAAGLATVTALNWNAILDWIKNVWNKIKSWWRTNVAPIFTLKYWTDLFKCIGEGLWNAIKAGINWVIDGINWLITQINKISFETPDWIPLIGGKRFGFNIPPIPRLASGAVIPPNSPRLAIVGDNRHEKELIAPESMFRQIVKEEIERIWGNGEITINLNNIMDGEVIAKKVIKVHNGIVRQTGASPLLI